jgi:hypothetical protein
MQTPVSPRRRASYSSSASFTRRRETAAELPLAVWTPVYSTLSRTPWRAGFWNWILAGQSSFVSVE